MKKETKKEIMFKVIMVIYIVMIVGFWNSEKYWVIGLLGAIGVTAMVGLWVYSWIEGSDD